MELSRDQALRDLVEFQFRNYYYCAACGCGWDDSWSSVCNDRCPQCDLEVEPLSSEDI